VTLPDFDYHVEALWFIALKQFYTIWFSNISILNVPAEKVVRETRRAN